MYNTWQMQHNDQCSFLGAMLNNNVLHKVIPVWQKKIQHHLQIHKVIQSTLFSYMQFKTVDWKNPQQTLYLTCQTQPIENLPINCTRICRPCDLYINVHQASVKISMHKRHCILFVYILTALLLLSIEFEVIGNNPIHKADC